MIKGLYETHIFVKDLAASITFYQDVLGLQQCYYEEERRAAFFWIGKPKEAMLGLWEKPAHEIDKRHFAFRCDPGDVLQHSATFFEERGIRPYNFLKDSSAKPMVFAWMPAIAIYFNDPDGHYLEFIGILDGAARPELGVISYDDWRSANENPQDVSM